MDKTKKETIKITYKLGVETMKVETRGKTKLG